MITSPIKHIFVLCLENQSFSRLMGYSGITGTDSITGQSTKLENLSETPFSNEYQGVVYTTTPDAPSSMPFDPNHEFLDVFKQLTNGEAVYDRKTQYEGEPMVMTGFVYNYANSKSPHTSHPKGDYQNIMRCYDTKTQLPALYSLASEFVVLNRYFASVPGPTIPNRFFLAAATSGGLETSPSSLDILKWEIEGVTFDNGTIYDALNKKGIEWQVYAGSKHPLEGSIPVSSMLKVVPLSKWRWFNSFTDDLKNDYKPYFTMIEANYGDCITSTYKGGTSQHPCDNIEAGDELIKIVFESIRNSPVWESSVLIVTWDEHGGMPDNVVPPRTVAPGDSTSRSVYNFNFEQLGVRLPALVISPLVEKNLIDNTVYDHTSILATIERLLDIPALTKRDANANDFLHLFTRTTPRECPSVLPKTNYNPEEHKSLLSFPTSTATSFPLRSNVHALRFAHMKILHELGIHKEMPSTPSEFHEDLKNTIALIDQHRSKKKHQDCCAVM